MRIQKFLFVAMTLSLGACSFKKDEVKQQEAAKATQEVLTQYEKNQEAKRQSETDGGKLTDQNVSVSFIENPMPGSYTMRITWPSSVVAMAIQINDKFEAQTTNENVFEEAVDNGQSYKIQLTSKNSLGVDIDKKEIIVQAPKDLIFDKSMTLDSNVSFDVNRAYFQPNVRVITNGFNLQIKAKKLFVGESQSSFSGFPNDAHIVTTPYYSIARNELQLKGSEISINASEAHGRLKVALIGFHGKNGRNGDDIDSANKIMKSIDPSLNGARGQDGVIFKDSVPCPKKRNMDIECEQTRLVCQKPPTNGADGLPGRQGTAGENGQAGGNSGSLFVSVQNPQDFSVEVGQLVGQPGRGGIGGTGFPGGLGGKAGNNPGHPCPNAQDGKPGAQGPQGPNGKTGDDGKLGYIQTGSVPLNLFPL